MKPNLTGITSCLIIGALLGSVKAADIKLPDGVTCEDVRRVVAEKGKVRALALALENGATWTQIKEARKCLKS